MMLVSTEDFWDAMCAPGFVRLSALSGRVRGRIVVTLEAPEDVPLFIARKVARVRDSLEPRVNFTFRLVLLQVGRAALNLIGVGFH